MSHTLWTSSTRGKKFFAVKISSIKVVEIYVCYGYKYLQTTVLILKVWPPTLNFRFAQKILENVILLYYSFNIFCVFAFFLNIFFYCTSAFFMDSLFLLLYLLFLRQVYKMITLSDMIVRSNSYDI